MKVFFIRTSGELQNVGGYPVGGSSIVNVRLGYKYTSVMIHHLSSDHLQNDIRSGNFDFLFFDKICLKRVFPVENGKIALVRASMVVTYYIKPFCTGADTHNGILMSLLLLVAETKSYIKMVSWSKVVKFLGLNWIILFKNNFISRRSAFRSSRQRCSVKTTFFTEHFWMTAPCCERNR